MKLRKVGEFESRRNNIISEIGRMNEVRCVSVSFGWLLVVVVCGLFGMVMCVGFLFVIVVVMRNNRMREHQQVC